MFSPFTYCLSVLLITRLSKLYMFSYWIHVKQFHATCSSYGYWFIYIIQIFDLLYRIMRMFI